MQIPENIKQARLSADKTQKEMAGLLGVPRTTYANWEIETVPDIETIKKIAQILGVEVSQLINANYEDVTPLYSIVELKRKIEEQWQVIVSQQETINIIAKRSPDIRDKTKNA